MRDQFTHCAKFAPLLLAGSTGTAALAAHHGSRDHGESCASYRACSEFRDRVEIERQRGPIAIPAHPRVLSSASKAPWRGCCERLLHMSNGCHADAMLQWSVHDEAAGGRLNGAWPAAAAAWCCTPMRWRPAMSLMSTSVDDLLLCCTRISDLL